MHMVTHMGTIITTGIVMAVMDIITTTTAADRPLEEGADGINPSDMKIMKIENIMEIQN